MCLLLLLLVAFAFSLHQILAKNPPGFISLDCGRRGSDGYNDSLTGLYYTTDGAYVETGVGRIISPEFRTEFAPQQFWNVRSFPGPAGSRNCYTLKPLHGKGNKVLLRVRFMYANYDDQDKLPQFDLHLGVNFWETVTFKHSTWLFETEILHIPTSDYLYVCLVNTGHGTPFISVIELRPMDPIYNTTSGSLKLYGRWNLGSKSDDALRYKGGDPYDRVWYTLHMANTIALNTTATSFNKNLFNVPPNIMRTAIQARRTNDSINVPIIPDDPDRQRTLTSDIPPFSDQVYSYLHFAELAPGQSREMNICLTGLLCYPNFVPAYLNVSTITMYNFFTFPISEIIITATSNSKLPAILNALEIYTVKQFPHYETDENEVAAIISIKSTYAITSNWQGDPCSPQNYTWIGINCSYNGFAPPNIISLNLSSRGLVGTISPSISNLTMLHSLDLSYNNLTGQVPDFLSRLHSLTHLYVQGNNFKGSLPPALLEKSKNGSLILSYGANDARKKKKTALVPIVASVGAFLAIFTISTLLCRIILRKRQVAEANRTDADLSMEPKLRKFTFSEVMSFIGQKKIIGVGGFGHVYLGNMNGTEVAIKVLNIYPEEQTKDFQAEVKIPATVYHKNLIRIFGYCNEGTNRAIIFELMENGNLKKHLSERNPNVLSWEHRLAIMIGAAEGLEYLHHGCKPPIIHRDIKPENILLTKEFEAKLADFGLSRIFPVQTSRVVGTHGYLDPEYKEPSILTEKIDVYSFGVLMLVVVTGQPAIRQRTTHITQWIAPKISDGDVTGIVDSRLEGSFDVNVAWRIIKLAMACASSNSLRRPDMHYVVKELKDCSQTALPQQEGDERRYSNDAAEITV